ncbi:single-stranded DNA-binding protein [Nitratireductor rhodophyticola]|uniref:single-stranded DNA-binding protein n=1 Tax=Nitratireductor rhodophyticola TaxID=2854036 RepID=UPI003BA9EBAF
MAGSLNKVQLIGNVGQDPEVRDLQSGNAVANFTVATSESWKDKNTGEKKEITQWHRIVVWVDGLVSIVEKYVKKGSKVYIEGELQTRKWTDQNGNDRYTTEVVLSGFNSKLVLLGDSGGGRASDQNGNADRPGNSAGGYAAQSGGSAGGQQNAIDDEIPF